MELTRFTAYYLGHEEIDKEHKDLYDALEKMWKTIPPDRIPALLIDAKEKCHYHFSHEEELMREYDYPFIKSHLEVHEKCIERFMSVIDHPTTESLGQLVDEFLDHIDLYDRLFVQFIMSNRRVSDKMCAEIASPQEC